MARKIGEKVFGFKGSGIGAEVTPEMLAKINRYALTPLTDGQVFVRKFLMAHNCIDRDNECFPDEMLDQFAVTMPGKSLLVGHNRRELPAGKFFEASTEVMSCDQFKALTGVDPRMPDGMDLCKVLWAWAYMVKSPSNEDLTQQIDGGVCDHCSIGFAAADLKAIRETPTGPAKYWQYVSPGEALEGSLVWLGAQPGATAQKALQADNKNVEEEKKMKEFYARLGKTLGLSRAPEDEDSAIKAVKEAMEGSGGPMCGTCSCRACTGGECATCTKNPTKSLDMKGLHAVAADGKAYRDDLVADTVKFAALLGEIEDTEKAKKDEEDFLKSVPIARLKAQRDKYETRAREKFPTHAVFSGKDQTDREKHGKEGEDKSKQVGGKKDFSRPEHNELFSTTGR